MKGAPLPLQVSLAILAGIVAVPAMGAQEITPRTEPSSSKEKAKEETATGGVEEWCRITAEVLRTSLDAESREKLEKAKAILCATTDRVECSPD
jgi:hypothetical protein